MCKLVKLSNFGVIDLDVIFIFFHELTTWKWMGFKCCCALIILLTLVWTWCIMHSFSSPPPGPSHCPLRFFTPSTSPVKEGTWRIVFNKFTNYNQQALNQERRTKCLHLWKLHLPKLPQLPQEVMQHVRGWHADLLVGSKLPFQFLLFHCLQIWNAFPLHGRSRNLRMELLLLLLDLLVSKKVQWDHQPEEEHQGNLFPTRVCFLAPAAICVELSVASHLCWIRRRRNTLHAWQTPSQTQESLNRNGGWCLQGNSPSLLANLATI